MANPIVANVKIIFYMSREKCFFFFLRKNYGSRSKKSEFLRFELSHNALNRKPQK